jgi:hypothetical protein
MRPRYGRKANEWQTLATGAVAAGLLVVTIIGASLRLATSMSARTGDIIRLNPTDPPVSDSEARVPAIVIGDGPDRVCMFDLRVMELSGGSVVIEATRFDPVLSYLVHWAGVRTSNDASDCGHAAELRVSADAIAALSMAAATR